MEKARRGSRRYNRTRPKPRRLCGEGEAPSEPASALGSHGGSPLPACLKGARAKYC